MTLTSVMIRQRVLLCMVVGLCVLFLYVTYSWSLFILANGGFRCSFEPGSRRTTEVIGSHSTAVSVTTQADLFNSTDFSDSTIEGTLPAAFQAALNNYSIVPPGDVKIVLLVTYYRAGSSFLGELLSSGPRTFFHFEPLIMFTVGGRLRKGRERHAFEVLDELVRCRMHKVPLYTVWFENNVYVKYNRFLADLCGGGQSCSSPPHMSALCSRATSQVFKFTRLSITQVAAWLRRNPEVAPSVRVLHLVRDPRAMYASRQKLYWCRSDKSCGDAGELCAQMRADLDAFDQLVGQMPPKRTHRIRFEDLATDAANETVRLYAKLGLDYTSSVSQYLLSHTTATKEDLRRFHSTKRNTADVANEWMKKLPRRTVARIEEVCGDVLQRLGYKFYPL
ncbi:carbohydrate sulfotransferase 5-like isoform X2 [Amblyomma americanum]